MIGSWYIVLEGCSILFDNIATLKDECIADKGMYEVMRKTYWMENGGELKKYIMFD